MNTSAEKEPVVSTRGSALADVKRKEFDQRFGESVVADNLKHKTIRGGAFTVSSQVTQFVLFTVSSVVLGRLLSPKDYGLVGMVSAVIGFLRVCNYAGLSTATVQRGALTHQLVSTLFWVNIALGLGMSCLSTLLAPGLAWFYREPRLYWITFALASNFLLDAVSSQHLALMRRQMRFRVVAILDITAMFIAVLSGILAALAGLGYWALVVSQTISPVVSAVGAWIAEPWRPGLPQRGTGVRSMVRFGGYLTGVSLLYYIFRNFDNVLIGWRWGAGPLGVYQKAYSLLMLPINQVNSPIQAVALSTLSRVTGDPDRQRRYFVAGYSLVTAVTVPIVVASAIFVGDIIPFLLGKQWTSSVRIFQFLAPAALIGTLLSPFYMFFISRGRTDRQFKSTVVWTALVVLAFVLGLKYGPEGVAIGFSGMSILLALPVCLYAIHGTPVRLSDIARALKHPVLAISLPAVLGVLVRMNALSWAPLPLRAIAGPALVLVGYAFTLLIVLRQWTFYHELLSHLLPSRRTA